MSVDLSKRIDMTCPVCEKGFHQTFGWLVKHSEVICPHCESAYDVRISDTEALKPAEIAAECSSFFTKITGVTHHNKDGKSRQRLISQCQVGEELLLEREPDNRVDPNAIKISRVTGEQLGYIPAHVAASGLAKNLDRGERPKCRIVNLTGGDGLTRGVNIEIGEWPDGSHRSEAAIPNESALPYGWIIFAFAIIAGVVLLFQLR